jgi:molecular chaperone GrpE
MQQDQENQQPELAAEDVEVTSEQNAPATPEARIAELEAALEEAKASVLYVKAEGENIRRRSMDDIDKARKFAF